MMKIPKRLPGTTLHTERESLDGEEDRYITRMAEMVRTIEAFTTSRTLKAWPLNAAFQQKTNMNTVLSKFHPQLIEGVKWIPDLVHSASERLVWLKPWSRFEED